MNLKRDLTWLSVEPNRMVGDAHLRLNLMFPMVNVGIPCVIEEVNSWESKFFDCGLVKWVFGTCQYKVKNFIWSSLRSCYLVRVDTSLIFKNWLVNALENLQDFWFILLFNLMVLNSNDLNSEKQVFHYTLLLIELCVYRLITPRLIVLSQVKKNMLIALVFNNPWQHEK